MRKASGMSLMQELSIFEAVRRCGLMAHEKFVQQNELVIFLAR